MKYIVSSYSNREEEPLEGFKEGSNMSRLQLSQHHPGYCVTAAMKRGGSRISQTSYEGAGGARERPVLCASRESTPRMHGLGRKSWGICWV